MKILSAITLLGVLFFGVSASAQETPPPETPPGDRSNVVMVMLDDATVRDAYLMPTIQRELVSKGTRFTNSFVSYPLCCPSRATFLTGKYPHNHKVLSNNFDTGGEKRFRAVGGDQDTIATRLDSAGYRTALVGRYFPTYEDASYVPPGWDRWRAFTHGGLSFGGQEEPVEGAVGGVSTGGQAAPRPDGNLDDWAAGQAASFVRDASEKPDPFYLQVGTHAPHSPQNPPERYRSLYPYTQAPRYPSFDERDVSDKPRWIRAKPRVGPSQTASIDAEYRGRLRSLRAADDLVGDVIATLEETGELNNTYVVLTSDNGYEFGEHRTRAKWAPHERSVRVPLIVRGPGVPEKATRPQFVLNNDYTPTVSEWTGTETPANPDGTSYAPLLSADPPKDWRTRFLIESWRDLEYRSPPTYKALRTPYFKYIEYASGERELYNLSSDPDERESIHRTKNRALVGSLHRALVRLSSCEGDSCRAAEGF